MAAPGEKPMAIDNLRLGSLGVFGGVLGLSAGDTRFEFRLREAEWRSARE